MFQQKIDARAAIPLEDAGHAEGDDCPIEVGTAARLWSALITCALPLILLWLLARIVWEDLKALGRAVNIFHQAVAEELSRRS